MEVTPGAQQPLFLMRLRCCPARFKMGSVIKEILTSGIIIAAALLLRHGDSEILLTVRLTWH